MKSDFTMSRKLLEHPGRWGMINSQRIDAQIGPPIQVPLQLPWAGKRIAVFVRQKWPVGDAFSRSRDDPRLRNLPSTRRRSADP